MKYRDNQLDAYRALVMIYILCVIHTMYWLEYSYELAKSLILFEMPVIFFISGAAFFLKTKGESTLSIIKNRFKRVILPYIIYVFVALVIIAILSVFDDDYNLTTITLIDIKSIVLVERIPLIPYCYHLWFIVPYFILLCTFHFQTRIIDNIKRKWLYLVAAVAVFFAATIVTRESTIRHCLCYNVFLISGYLYYKRMKVTSMLSIALASMCLLTAWYFYGGNIIPMQAHKFPPDMIFLVFGVMALALLGVLFTFVKIPSQHFLNIWNRHGYTIYLYQNYSFFIVASLLSPPLFLPDKNWITLLISALLIFVVSTLSSYIIVPFESKCSNWLCNTTDYLYHKLLHIHNKAYTQ